MNQKKNWILLADGGNARVIERTAPFGKLKQIFHLTVRHCVQYKHVTLLDSPGNPNNKQPLMEPQPVI